MTQTCSTTRSPTAIANLNSETRLVERYEAHEFDAPFKIVLCNAVKQTVCIASGEVIGTTIPNLSDLRKEIALSRCLHHRRLSPSELKFVRKLMRIPANGLARKLGISAEHLSRCESGDRVLSVSAEKLFRVLVLKERHKIADVAAAIIEFFSDENSDRSIVDKFKSALEVVQEKLALLEQDILESDLEEIYDVDHQIVLFFGLHPSDHKTDHEGNDVDEGTWRKAS